MDKPFFLCDRACPGEPGRMLEMSKGLDGRLCLGFVTRDRAPRSRGRTFVFTFTPNEVGARCGLLALAWKGKASDFYPPPAALHDAWSAPMTREQALATWRRLFARHGRHWSGHHIPPADWLAYNLTSTVLTTTDRRMAVGLAA
jgi:hypothetical protein